MVTHHQITVDGKLLKYTATAGRLPIKRGDGKIEAEMFYVAYTLDGQEAPSALSLSLTTAARDRLPSGCTWVRWVHAASCCSPTASCLRAPYRIEDNPYTLLDKSDLVLVDAIGTGFSRAGDSRNAEEILGSERRH